LYVTPKPSRLTDGFLAGVGVVDVLSRVGDGEAGGFDREGGRSEEWAGEMKPRLTTRCGVGVCRSRLPAAGGSDDRGKSGRSERDQEGSEIGDQEGIGTRKRMRENELLRGVVKL
jgi:hypothetical protein